MRYRNGMNLLLGLVLCCGGVVRADGSAAGSAPEAFSSFTRDWRDDPSWYDGKAECCVYDATRTIYGRERRYEARVYTDKELADPQTKTKSSTGRGREVFKQHVRDDVPTERYTYHFSTMCYVGTGDLKSLKVEMGSQEDCGASFKQFVNHAGRLTWHSFVYFPDTGHSHGEYAPPRDWVFQDALSVVLRGYPFDLPLGPIEVNLLPDQTSTRPTGWKAERAWIEYVGRERLELPIGAVEAEHLRVLTEGGVEHEYWFAAEGGRPWLHVMVQYEGPEGVRYRLRSMERSAYWER